MARHSPRDVIKSPLPNSNSINIGSCGFGAAVEVYHFSTTSIIVITRRSLPCRAACDHNLSTARLKKVKE